MGYRKRTGFLAGLTVAQISEFSLIFMAMGLSLGHISTDAVGLVTLVGLITISLSVYMITHSYTLYGWLEPFLSVFERKKPFREQSHEDLALDHQGYDVILFGLGRYGKTMAHYLEQEKFSFLAVDFNPQEVKWWRKKGKAVIYGDASDPAFIGGLPLSGVKWVISAMPQHDLGLTHKDPRLVLIDTLKEHGFTGQIAISTQRPEDATILEEKGADIILLPFHDAAEQAVTRIREETVFEHRN